MKRFNRECQQGGQTDPELEAIWKPQTHLNELIGPLRGYLYNNLCLHTNIPKYSNITNLRILGLWSGMALGLHTRELLTMLTRNLGSELSEDHLEAHGHRDVRVECHTCAKSETQLQRNTISELFAHAVRSGLTIIRALAVKAHSTCFGMTFCAQLWATLPFTWFASKAS
jgi:hypothetical protein